MSMQMNATLSQRMTQSMVLAPRMIQSMEILQLPIMELQERIQQELDENPVLELKDTEETAPTEGEAENFEEPFEPAPEDDRDPGAGELSIEDNGSNELDFERLDALSRDWEDHFNEEHRPSRNGLDEEGDKKHDAMQNMASPPQSLQDYLNDQLAFFDLPADQLRLVRYLISYIDENGFVSVPDEREIATKLDEALNKVREESQRRERERERETDPEKEADRVRKERERLQEEERDAEDRVRLSVPRRVPTLEELAKGYDLSVTPDDVEDGLQVIQKLDPPGVGARDLRECLLLQLRPETPHRDILRVLVQNHLEDIQHNRLPAIQRRTGFEIRAIKDAIEVLKHFNPRPGSQFAATNIPYVVPDILVERAESGEYTVRLLDDWLPRVYISQRYVDLYKEKAGDVKTREYLKKKLQAAQWLKEAIEQRRGTLEKVTKAIIQHQKAFLDQGPEHIHPLKMQQIADQVGVHVTTVSRAVDDKWVQTPRGIFPLKRFFGGGMKVEQGEEVAWEVIKQKLLEIIDQEDKTNPLSDEELVIRLTEAGYPIKRRTVTKYRQMANIPSSRQRKDWASVQA
jgi:RNA polymerase sigma-54 factor